MSKISRDPIPSDSRDSEYPTLCLDSKHEASIHSATDDTHSTHQPLLWSQLREYCRDAFSEFFGTMILILFGNGVVAQVLLSNGQKGDYQSISWGWG